jgi:hypothetical protein
MIKVVYQITHGTFPYTRVVHESKTRIEAEAWLALNPNAKKYKINPVHLAWLHGGWHRVNSNPVSVDKEAYADFNDSTLRQVVPFKQGKRNEL